MTTCDHNLEHPCYLMSAKCQPRVMLLVKVMVALGQMEATTMTYGSNGWGYAIRTKNIHVDAFTMREAWDKYVGALIYRFYRAHA